MPTTIATAPRESTVSPPTNAKLEGVGIALRSLGCALGGIALGFGYLTVRFGPDFLMTPTGLEVLACILVVSILVALTSYTLITSRSRAELQLLGDAANNAIHRGEDGALQLLSDQAHLLPLIEPLRDLIHAHQSALDQIVVLQGRIEESEEPGGWLPRLTNNGSENDPFPHSRSRQYMIARLTTHLHWVAITPMLQKFLGRSVEELRGKPFLEIVHPEDRKAVNQAFEEAVHEGESHNVVIRSLVRERHLQLHVMAYFDAGGKLSQFRCHFVDVTDRAQAQQQVQRRTAELLHVNERLRSINSDLERLKESYRDLYHYAPVIYFSLNRQGKMVAINETLLRVLGYQREELLNQPYSILLTPGERDRWNEHPDILQRPGSLESQWIKKDGSVIEVWINSTIITDEDGTFHRSRSAALDITERNVLARQVEDRARALARANVQLRKTNQELEDFTFVVSHDLKEPLRTLEAFSNFLKMDCSDQLSPEGLDHIEHLIAASKRLGQLINDLLTLSRAGRVIGQPKEIDWEMVTDIMQADLQELLANKENASIQILGPLPTVLGDPERIIQLLTNLVGNALKYNNSSQPLVVIGALDSNDSDVETFFVRDNGIGIDSRFHQEIFRIFRRLHHREDYPGTGAGLAICKKIVEAHGGQIRVDSVPGKGSTFYFSIPKRS